MTSIQVSGERPNKMPSTGEVDTKLEVVVIPVSDVDRAERFYTGLGWRLDADVITGEDFRVVQVTPPGSQCSIIFGQAVTSAVPGSAQGFHLMVSDIEAARAELVDRGVDVSELFHDAGGVFHHAGFEGRDRPGSRAAQLRLVRVVQRSGWQRLAAPEITMRLPGRVDADETTFASAAELATALRRAAAAHGKHEERIGKADPDWPSWYAEYMVREQAGAELPS